VEILIVFSRMERDRLECVIFTMLVAVVAAFGSAAAKAREGDSIAYAVKAAYLYKLGAFVEWPASAFTAPDSPVNLCVVGDDPFDGTLDKAVEGQHIGNRPIVVRRLKTLVRDSGCQIVYAGTSDAQQASRWLETARGAQILTVTDSMPSATGAGIINFVIRDNHVRFEIDNQSAIANGLAISSKLLALAQPPRSQGAGD
jgi:hypothetical protein